SAGVFNLEKLEWLNFQYLKERSPEQLARDLRAFLERRGTPIPGDDRWLARMVATLRERAKTLLELADHGRFYLSDDLTFDDKAVRKFLTREIAPLLRDLIAGLEALPDWTVSSVEDAFRAVLAPSGKSLGALAQPVRVALTGGTASPGIFEVIDVLGRER